jgi:hypothetical protein
MKVHFIIIYHPPAKRPETHRTLFTSGGTFMPTIQNRASSVDLTMSKQSSSNGFTPQKSLQLAAIILLIVEIFVIIIFGTCTKEELLVEDFTLVYQMFTGILIMMLFGFGYLMTFLSRYGLGAIGFSLLITVLGKILLLILNIIAHIIYYSYSIWNSCRGILQKRLSRSLGIHQS